MVQQETTDDDQSITLAPVNKTYDVVIANALPMRLQTLDLTRHTVIAPDERRYVVATFDDTHIGRGYVTSVYPQQNNYLTLIRLTVCEFRSKTPDEAIARHRAVVEAIQQGRLNELLSAKSA